MALLRYMSSECLNIATYLYETLQYISKMIFTSTHIRIICYLKTLVETI